MFFVNKIVLTIIVGIIVIGGAVSFIEQISTGQKEVATSTVSTNLNSIPNFEVVAPKNIVTSKITASMADLLFTKDSLLCTYSTTTENGVSSGIVYKSNGKMYAEIISPSTIQGSASNESKLIFIDDSLYMWGPFSENGIKLTGMSAELNDILNKSREQSILEQSNDYECKQWSVDVSKFILPSSIKFVDFEEQLQKSIDDSKKSNP